MNYYDPFGIAAQNMGMNKQAGPVVDMDAMYVLGSVTRSLYGSMNKQAMDPVTAMRLKSILAGIGIGGLAGTGLGAVSGIVPGAMFGAADPNTTAGSGAKTGLKLGALSGGLGGALSGGAIGNILASTAR